MDIFQGKTLQTSGYGRHKVISFFNGLTGTVGYGTDRVVCECIPQPNEWVDITNETWNLEINYKKKHARRKKNDFFHGSISDSFELSF